MRQDQHDIYTGDHEANNLPPYIDWVAIKKTQPRSAER
jgi:hypothetical protein